MSNFLTNVFTTGFRLFHCFSKAFIDFAREIAPFVTTDFTGMGVN